MSALFQVANASDAWLKAAKFISEEGSCIGLHVEIAKPLEYDAELVAAVDNMLKMKGYISCKHVAYTIFPEGLWRKMTGDPEELFKRYNRPGGAYERLRRHRRVSRHNDWGSYFQRLSAPEFTERGEGQLTQAIRALRRKSKPAGAIHLHTGMPDDDDNIHLHTGLPKDGIRKIGGPCLQIITVHAEHVNGGCALSACALYRNHDFFQKALGNYIGLGQLLGFVAECATMKVGKLHVISGHAYCSPIGPVKEVLRAFRS